ncbi:SNF2 family N-terminal domain-containing protein [Lophiotrema nucula]|uniref:SNF2 family N-terminal domain-containing protein n=1 Tax=Lophiotrema nucula TaxID=690887 RepID=A0A6A5YSI7_9PLEO|nr:SNF2 family N-terminal domain-containing protein [Lophiotrema nucula]
MDPRLLLDPKGSRNRETASSNGIQKSQATGKRPASAGGEEANGGQISLVERLHNVHERTSSPSKRAKTDEQHHKQKARGAPGGGGLDLQNNRPPPPLPQAPAIDLTMSDDEDDDIKVVKDNSSETICIGRLKNMYIQTHTVPQPDPSKFRGNSGQQGRIRVRYRRAGFNKGNNLILVVDPTGKEFGRVDIKTAVGLSPLMDSAKTCGLQWAAMTDPRRKQPGEGPPGAIMSALIAVSTQLYCPRKVARDLGKYLQSKQMFLIDPIFDLNKFDYFNPQTAANFTTQDAAQSDFQYPMHNAPGYTSNYVIRSVDEIRADVQNVFDKMITSGLIAEREQPASIKTPLMSHQKQALHFLWDKEQPWTEADETRIDTLYQAKLKDNGRKYWLHVITGEELRHPPDTPRGGILADEMGLGKTLSILSLIALPESIAAAQHFATLAPPISQGLGTQVINSRATLLICPLSTRYNWTTQVNDHFLPGCRPKVCNYHGPRRNDLSIEQLADYDLVITTYDTVSVDAPKNKPLTRINWFRIVLDEAHAIRNPTARKSIMVCGLSAQRRWAVTGTPVQNRLEDLGALFKFLRLRPFNDAAGFNQFVVAPFKAADEGVIDRLRLLVGSITLRRQKNGLVELPTKTDQIVRLKFSKDEQRLHDWFEKDSANKVNAITSGEKVKGHSYARILTAIMNLRLICAHGRDLLSEEALKLTDGMTYDNPMELEDGETEIPPLTKRAAYDMVELLNQTDADACQICQQRLLEIDSDDEEDVDDAEQDYGSEECSARPSEEPEPILEKVGNRAGADVKLKNSKDIMAYMTGCYHIICPKHRKVIQQWYAAGGSDGQMNCIFCDTRVRTALFELKQSEWEEYLEEKDNIKRDPKLAKKMGSYTGPHTKTKALLEELRKSQEESMANPDEPPIKSVIFSCWTTHLDLIQIALEGEGYRYTRLDGRMPGAARNKALDIFAKDFSVPIILVSIGAGGLGLNLTTANKVYVMEPQFNPAAEAQAVDRVHRLGQTRPVTIMRYIMDDSFEEKMLELQRKKRDLADLTMSREKTTKQQQAKQRLEDLRSLFK